MIIYSRYYNNVDHTWYDSSNIHYSEWDESSTKSILKLVFNNGRAYTYENVDVNDYLMFKADSISTGKAANQYIIKKYTGTRIDDVQLDVLDNLKEDLINFDTTMSKTLSELNMYVEVCNEDWVVKINDIVLAKFNITENPNYIRLLNSFGLFNNFKTQTELDCSE